MGRGPPIERVSVPGVVEGMVKARRGGSRGCEVLGTRGSSSGRPERRGICTSAVRGGEGKIEHPLEQPFVDVKALAQLRILLVIPTGQSVPCGQW